MIVDLESNKYIGMTEEQATHAAARELTELSVARNDFKVEMRSYEISLWTLQDEFMTVLKWSDAEQSGRIEDPEMTLKVDGTQELKFDIPMYLYVYFDDRFYAKAERIENPIWYTTQDELLLQGMRKIKVTFNKGTNDQQIFEFLITKVTEEHKDDQLFCHIECEGLAFHELGKIGYKITFSLDEYNTHYEEYIKKGYWTRYDGSTSNVQPRATINYWCEECGLKLWPGTDEPIDPKTWYYDIRMNWDSFNNLTSNTQREINKMYEDEYVSNWSDTLQPLSVESAREKERTISVSESNIYNITQTIAERFNVFCKYQYEHDDNGHIIARIVIFYNNYLMEENGIVSLTYPYTSTAITREIDSTELTTKMYVKSQDDNSLLGGTISITDVAANPSQEDYLYNFDYMYKCKAITEEQYAEVKEYEKELKRLNTALAEYAAKLNAYEQQRIELEADKATQENLITVASEQINNFQTLYNQIEKNSPIPENGWLERAADSNYSVLAMESSNGGYYIRCNEYDKGIKEDSIEIYKTYSAKSNPKLSNQINNYTVKKDKYDDIIEIHFPSDTFTSNESKMVHLIYSYSPKFYYDSVIAQWVDTRDNAEEALGLPTISDEEEPIEPGPDTILGKLNDINEKIAATTTDQNETSYEKKQATEQFEILMRGAIREGYWQPSEYQDYGENKESNLMMSLIYNNDNRVDPSIENVFIWDTKLFSNEIPIYYEEGTQLNKEYYPCINISGQLDSICDKLKNSNGTLSFIAVNNIRNTDEAIQAPLQDLVVLTLGSNMEFGFLRAENNSIIPVLILTGMKKYPDDEIKFMLSQGHPYVCTFNTTVESNEPLQASIYTGTYPIQININDIYWDQSKWSESEINKPQELKNMTRVYPRIRLNNLSLKTTEDTMALRFKNELLTRYVDYTPAARTNLREQNNEVVSAQQEYYLTIKPEVLFSRYDIDESLIGTFNLKYQISNAATEIYLDAKKIMKENSEPKVSYTIEVNAFNQNYIKILYRMLAQLVMINDTDLKFENEFGYISELVLNLDAPQEDKIEIKNYKSKFEDLFSTIVAQTEEMRKNEGAFNALVEGHVPLASDAVEIILEDTKISNILNAYLDSHFDSSEVVQNRLASLFEEAASILVNAQTATNSVYELSTENAKILGSFASPIQLELTPKVFNSENRPNDFKVGDIWHKINSSGQIVGYYVATGSSNDSGEGGWTQTYDGQLSQIRGANVSYNAATGEVKVTGEHKIELESGKHVRVAAGDSVDIIGNQAVNIGGGTINITASANPDLNGGYTSGGINLISSNANVDFTESDNTIQNVIAAAIKNNDGTLTKVLIHPDQIEMAGANIIMKGAQKILSVASNGSNSNQGTSAIQISPTEGIWIGSDKGIRLYSGTTSFKYNDSDKSIAPNVGANIELTSEHLILGYSENGATQAIEMKKEYLVIASGEIIKSSGNKITTGVNGTSTGLVGAKFTKDSIGFATSANNIINAILMNNDGITVGSGVDVTSTTSALRSNSNGSYVRIAPSGIELGSAAELYVNMNNFKLQTDILPNDSVPTTRFAIGRGLHNIDANTAEGIGTTNDSFVGLVYNKNGLFVSGAIYASSFELIGNTKIQINQIDSTGLNNAIENNSTVAGAASITEAFTNNGLLTDYVWGTDEQNNPITWKVALTSTSNLLIGANGNTEMTGGIWIAKSANFSDGAALILDKNGIALNGASISLVASSAQNASQVQIGSEGIDLHSSYLKINTSNLLIDPTVNTGSIFALKTATEKILDYKADGTLSLRANSIILEGTDTDNSIIQMSSGKFDVRANQGALSFGKRWFITTDSEPENVVVQEGDILQIQEGNNKGLYIWRYIETDEYSGSAWSPLVFGENGEAVDALDANSNFTELGLRIITEYINSATLQLTPDGTLICTNLIVLNDITCYGTVQAVNTTPLVLANNEAASDTELMFSSPTANI